MNNKIDFIQGLRGVACLAVVFFHGSNVISPYGEGLGDQIFGTFGYFGVALFFIISGFIMTITTANFDGSIAYVKDFFVKRIVRVWPLYVIATLLSLILIVGVGTLNDYNNVIKLMKSLIFIPAGDGASPVFGFPTLVVGWTLNYEMYFYLIFGLSMMAGKYRWISFYLFTAVMLLLIPIIHTGTYSLNPKDSYSFTNPLMMIATSPIIWLFVSGVAIGNIYKSRLEIKSKAVCWHLVMFALVIVVAQCVAKTRIGHGIADWGITLIPLMLVLTITSKTIDLNPGKALIYLGNISYSMYLFHPIAQSITLHGLVKMSFGDFSYGFQALFISTALSITLGSISYFLLEKKISVTIYKLTHR